MTGQSEFIPRMGPEGVLCHHLLGDLSRQFGRYTTLLVDRGEFGQLRFRLRGKFAALTRHVGFFRIGLGTDRHIFACSHRHCSGDEPRYASNQNFVGSGGRGGNTDDQTRC